MRPIENLSAYGGVRAQGGSPITYAGSLPRPPSAVSSVLEFSQEFIPGSHPPDSQQGSAGFSVSLPGVFRRLASSFVA